MQDFIVLKCLLPLRRRDNQAVISPNVKQIFADPRYARGGLWPQLGVFLAFQI